MFLMFLLLLCIHSVACKGTIQLAEKKSSFYGTVVTCSGERAQGVLVKVQLGEKSYEKLSNARGQYVILTPLVSPPPPAQIVAKILVPKYSIEKLIWDNFDTENVYLTQTNLTLPCIPRSTASSNETDTPIAFITPCIGVILASIVFLSGYTIAKRNEQQRPTTSPSSLHQKVRHQAFYVDGDTVNGFSYVADANDDIHMSQEFRNHLRTNTPSDAFLLLKKQLHQRK